MLQLVNTLHSFELEPGITALGLVKPYKQCNAEESDRLVAHAYIYLPCMEHTRLDVRLQFAERLTLFGEPLNSNFGGRAPISKRDWRMASMSFKADTWREALEMACEYLLEQVAILRQALKRRADMLRSEGEEYYLALAIGSEHDPVPYDGPYPEVKS